MNTKLNRCRCDNPDAIRSIHRYCWECGTCGKIIITDIEASSVGLDRRLILQNIDKDTLTLIRESASSTATNRFHLPKKQDVSDRLEVIDPNLQRLLRVLESNDD